MQELRCFFRRYFQYVREEMLKDFDRDTDNDAFPMAMPRVVQCFCHRVFLQ